MFGIGSAEAGVILVVVLLLFAPTVVAFLVGYNLGQRRVAPKTEAGAGTALEVSGGDGPDAAAPDAPAARAQEAEGDEATDG